MPRQKDLKRLVRARMSRTGEAYTAARAQLLKKSRRTTRRAPSRAVRDAAAGTTDFATLAGMSDEAIQKKTGCNWARWVHALDMNGAATMPHRDIAKLVHTKFKTGDWWAQTVTVGFERIKGIRARGQRRDGSFEANKSRTYNVPVTVLFEAWSDEQQRRRWLSEERMKVRTATAPKSMRLDWPDGGLITVGFMSKGKDKSSVALAHSRLPDRETAERAKEEWAERLDALGDLLGDR